MEGINCLGFKEVVGGLVAKSYLTLVTPRPCSLQGPLSMGLSRQEYWSGLSFPPTGDLPNPGVEFSSPVSPALQPDSIPAASENPRLWFWAKLTKFHTLNISN